ncbi:MAG: hypothetical protein PHW84_04725 [Methanosarcina sp.]|jgi:hypothetical protein|nr:hypothetical protein [Methanosarcina sp.]
MRRASKVGLMNEEETVKALEMIDLRLKSEHVSCQEEDVEEIYRQFKGYWKLMDKVCRRIVKRLSRIFPSRRQKNKNKVVVI